MKQQACQVIVLLAFHTRHPLTFQSLTQFHHVITLHCIIASVSPPVEVKEEIAASEVNASIWGSSSSTAMEEKFTTSPTSPSTVFNLARKIAYLQ